ncbi:MAG: hypothetical protein AAF399_15985 [Bacteroidota bacterium]
MHRNFFLLPVFLFLAFSASAQTLQIGGKVGANSQRPLAGQSVESTTNGGSMGLFAAYQREQYKMGFRIELNYQNHWKSLLEEQVEVPLLAEIAIDPKQRLRLQAGPYLGVGREDEEALKRGGLRFRWGFTTGLEVNIPLSRKWVLVSDARVDKSWQAPENMDPKQQYLVPSKSLRFYLSFGLAYRLQRLKKRRR